MIDRWRSLIRISGGLSRPDVQIRPARESDAASACDAVNAVAAEKWYLGLMALRRAKTGIGMPNGPFA